MPRWTPCPARCVNGVVRGGRCARCSGVGQIPASDDRGKGDHKAPAKPKRRRRR